MPARSRHRARRPAREATMQMTLRHAQGRTLFRRPFFTLWTRFDLTPEEGQLIGRYHMADAVLSEGDEELNERARKRAHRTALAATAVVLGIMIWYYFLHLEIIFNSLKFILFYSGDQIIEDAGYGQLSTEPLY